MISISLSIHLRCIRVGAICYNFDFCKFMYLHLEKLMRKGNDYFILILIGPRGIFRKSCLRAYDGITNNWLMIKGFCVCACVYVCACGIDWIINHYNKVGVFFILSARKPVLASLRCKCCVNLLTIYEVILP